MRKIVLSWTLLSIVLRCASTDSFVNCFQSKYQNPRHSIVISKPKHVRVRVPARVRLRDPAILVPFPLPSTSTPLRAAAWNSNESNNNNSHEQSFALSSQTIEFELKPSISTISPQSWNSCLDDSSSSSSPFLEYSWLLCLEESGCASPTTGWIPQHVEIKLDGSVCAYVPLYVKGNSMGEFIFDSEWAQYAQKQFNVKYYPKLLSGIPFTPVTCTKILMSSGLRYKLTHSHGHDGREHGIISSRGIEEFHALVAKMIQNIASSNNISSLHLNFITDDEANHIAGPLSKPQFLKDQEEEQQKQQQQLSRKEKDYIDVHAKNDNGNDDDDDYDDVTNKNSKYSSTTSSSSPPIQERVKSVIQKIVSTTTNATTKQYDYIRKTSLQYHWQNKNPNNNNLPYKSFDEYMNCFKSKKRINIKRERRKVLMDENICIDTIVGKDILKYPGLVEKMFDIYKSTVDKMWFGQQYLTLEFFQMLTKSDFIDNLLFMCARRRKRGNGHNDNIDDNEDHDFNVDDVFAGTFNIIKNGVFYGRYWGCLPKFNVKNLHFEVCYWSAIEYCINNGFHKMEPGAGGGDYKWARGFDPVLIHSAHYISKPSLRRAIREYVQFDSERNIAISSILNERSVVKK